MNDVALRANEVLCKETNETSKWLEMLWKSSILMKQDTKLLTASVQQ